MLRTPWSATALPQRPDPACGGTGGSESGQDLPPAVDAQDITPTEALTPETYFGVGKVANYHGGGTYDEGTRTFAPPAQLPEDSFALRGTWALDYQGITAQNDDNAIALNYHARNVYMVVGGTGTSTSFTLARINAGPAGR